MPRYKAHLWGAALLYAIILILIGICASISSCIAYIGWLVCMLAGALFPDIDTKSKGQKYSYLLLFGIMMFLLVQELYAPALIIGVLAMMPLLVPHRGLFHRSWFLVVMPLALWMLYHIFYPRVAKALFINVLFFIIGSLSHVWMDKKLVPWLRSWRLLRR